jgi:hypothetical protein
MGRAMRITAIVLSACVAAACSSPTVSPPEASPAASTISAPTRSPPVASPSASAISQGLPAPTCNPEEMLEVPAVGSPFQVPTTLTCAAAVAAASRVLPTKVRSGITGIEFHYGSYCAPGGFCAISSPQDGYVVFWTTENGSQPGLLVEVRADETGVVKVTGGPSPFPLQPASSPISVPSAT